MEIIIISSIRKKNKVNKINKHTKNFISSLLKDSNNQSWHYNQPFVNHFEWTEYTIKNLAKINF